MYDFVWICLCQSHIKKQMNKKKQIQQIKQAFHCRYVIT